MEEEARQILKRALAAPERLGDLFVKHFGMDRGVDLELPGREPHEPMDWGREESGSEYSGRPG